MTSNPPESRVTSKEPKETLAGFLKKFVSLPKVDRAARRMIAARNARRQVDGTFAKKP